MSCKMMRPHFLHTEYDANPILYGLANNELKPIERFRNFFAILAPHTFFTNWQANMVEAEALYAFNVS